MQNSIYNLTRFAQYRPKPAANFDPHSRYQPNVFPMLVHRIPAGPTLKQHWVSTSCLLGDCWFNVWDVPPASIFLWSRNVTRVIMNASSSLSCILLHGGRIGSSADVWLQWSFGRAVYLVGWIKENGIRFYLVGWLLCGCMVIINCQVFERLFGWWAHGFVC